MVTVKRNESGRGDTMVLERPDVLDFTTEYQDSKSTTIDELLTYERHSVEEDRKVDSIRIETLLKEMDATSLTAVKDDTIPSSTTMQFKDEKTTEEFYQNDIEQSSFSFKLNKKGKMLIAIYSIAVALILALIILNTGVINALQARLDEKAQSVASLQAQYSEIVQEIDYVSSDEYVIDKAVNEYNMSK